MLLRLLASKCLALDFMKETRPIFKLLKKFAFILLFIYVIINQVISINNCRFLD